MTRRRVLAALALVAAPQAPATPPPMHLSWEEWERLRVVLQSEATRTPDWSVAYNKALAICRERVEG